MGSELPQGFKLDAPAPAELPAGFKLDAPSVPAAPQHAADEPLAGGALNFVPAVPVGETALAIGSNIVAAPLAGYAGLAGAALPGDQGQGARWADRVQQALSYEPRTYGAQRMVEAASLPGRAVSYVADKVGEKGAEYSPMLGTIGKTSTEILPVLLGARAASTKPTPMTPKQARAAEAMDAGFSLTPEEAGAGIVGRTMASIGGEPRLARAISNKNQPVMVEKLAGELNIPKGTTLDTDAIKAVLKNEHRAYENVRNTGMVEATPQYYADLDALNAKYAKVARDFPDMAPRDLQAIIEGARKNVFDASAGVDLVNQLRQSASDAFASRQSGLGKVYRGVADAVEAELGRHVQSIGQPQLYKQFTEARTRIAKAHMLEDALLSPDSINPKVYAEAARDRAPLTGASKEVGEFAASNERSAMKPSSIGTSATLADVGAALLSGIRSQGGSMVLDALTLGARPAMRSFLTSRPGQWMIDPRTNLSGQAMEALGVRSVPSPQEEIR